MAAADDRTPAAAALKTPNVSVEDFVSAFNKQRTTLAGFSKCSNQDELDIVRDGFYLGLAKDLCPDAYKAVLILILRKKFDKGESRSPESTKGIVEEGDQGMLSFSFEEMVLAARECDKPRYTEPTTDDDSNESNNATKDLAPTTPTTYWKDLVDTVLVIGDSVGSDLESIWKTLEEGRLSWLRAVSVAHPIKVILKKALEDDNALDSAGDVSDAMMVWIYSICLSLADGTTQSTATDEETTSAASATKHQIKAAVDQWVDAVNMTERNNPLKGYQAELWDPRREEWRALESFAQQAAESGGAELLEAWKA